MTLENYIDTFKIVYPKLKIKQPPESLPATKKPILKIRPATKKSIIPLTLPKSPTSPILLKSPTLHIHSAPISPIIPELSPVPKMPTLKIQGSTKKTASKKPT